MNGKDAYLPTIGLEIHAELKTSSKMFCSCRNNPDEEKPNVNICPICVGHPGTLPVLNMHAIKKVLEIGLAVKGSIADFTEWDRKNYFYPDIPKGYQVSQYKYPLVSGGMLAGVEVERIHLEEDTAQSTHDTHKKSLINFNRAGVPLMELVTKPVIHDAATAVRFAKELQLLLRYLGAGEANMEKGEMRVEANISVATSLPLLGTKTEVKNLNSFRAVEGSIAYEIERQISLLEKGEKIKQETRGWDDSKKETYSQRSKESSHDYRYFPDPDIPKLKISEIPEFKTAVLNRDVPELPWNKRDRYKKDYGMTDKEVAVFVDSPEVAAYFEAVISAYKNDSKKVKLSINYILTDYLGMLKKEAVEKEGGQAEKVGIIPAPYFSSLVEMIAIGDVSSRGAKDLLAILYRGATGKGSKDSDAHNDDAIKFVRSLAEKNGLIQKSDLSSLSPAIDKVISDNGSVVSEYKSGKTASLQFLIGQAMKATKGSANPEIVRKLLLEKLS